MPRFKFKDEEIAVANKTARVRPPGKVISVVPRATMMLASKKNRILDFGAGHNIYHTKMLREQGYKVTAHDFGKNFNDNHDINALNKRYDIVMASNVLNVQSSPNMLYATLRQIRSVMKDGGKAVVNYPKSPRKMNFSTGEMEKVLKKYFKHICRLESFATDTWIVYKERNGTCQN